MVKPEKGKTMNQEFGFGDIAMIENPYGLSFRVRIVETIIDEDGSVWYEVKPTDFEIVECNMIVPQKALKRI